MKCAHPGRCRTLAALLVCAVCASAPLANGQLVGLPPDPAGSLQPSEAAPPSATAGAAETPPPSFPKMVLLDAGHVLSSPARWQGREWTLFAASTAGLAALSLADESLSNAAQERGTSLGSFGTALEQMGSGGSFVLLGGFYLAGAIGHDSKAKNVCLDGLTASLLASGIITPVLSTLVGRERPSAGEGAYSFKPFDGRSFPSGHATQAFAVASVIATSYDQLWVQIAAYGAASVTAYSRVWSGQHFPTDVVAGALIGTLVGRSVVHLNTKLRSGEREPEKTGVRLTLLPLVSRDTLGISGTVEF